MEAKRLLNGNIILPDTSVANRSVVLASQQDKIVNSPAPTPSPESLGTLAPTLSPAEGPPLPDPEPSASILHPDLRASTPPGPVTPTPALIVPAQLALAPLSTLSPVPNSVKFGPGIEESLPYSAVAQATYLSPAATTGDYLSATPKATTRKLHRTPSLLAFLPSKYRKLIGTLPEAFRHPASALIHSYV